VRFEHRLDAAVLDLGCLAEYIDSDENLRDDDWATARAINVLRFGTPRDDGQANSARVKLAKLKRCICAVPGVRHTFPTHCKTKRYVLAFVVMKQ